MTEQQLEKGFAFKPAKEDQCERYTAIELNCLDLGRKILEVTKPSREQSLAFTKLQECAMWAAKAIAVNE